MDTPAITVAGVSRYFGLVQALTDVSLECRYGEVLAILGENGAGKTTLMRILAGLDRASSGQLLKRTEPYLPRSPRDAVAAGVTLVQQHFALVPTMTATENILLFRNRHDARTTRSEAASDLQALASRLGFDIDPDQLVGEMSVGTRQRLELLRALDSNPDVLLLDEPTSVLTDAESDSLLQIVKNLAHDDNRSIVFITHRLREVVKAADRVVVLRDGRVVSPAAPVGERTAAGLAAEMVGEEVHDAVRDAKHLGDPRLIVEDLAAEGVGPLSLSVHAGEVLGIAGVGGNGQTELEAVLIGARRRIGGEAHFDGNVLTEIHPRQRISYNIAYIPSDRDRTALVGSMRCDENLLLGRTTRLTRRHEDAKPLMEKWSVVGFPELDAAALSGGNAQKLVAAREMESNPALMLAFQPTRGLDPGATAFLRQALLDTTTGGSAVLWVSADLDELLAVADRIMVMFSGQIVGEFEPPFNRAAIGLAMAGMA
ncbi:MAG: ABC transporter ATP-binding protein [Acidimicrobiia bacterium]|nr:MAG: ABC transporter ATP-binding protein [Acidimicrobiia bacterium]